MPYLAMQRNIPASPPTRRLAMQRLSWTLLFVTFSAFTAPAVDDARPPAPIKIAGVELRDIPATADGKPRVVSPEGVAYLEKLNKRTPFGTNDFDFKGLRAGM